MKLLICICTYNRNHSLLKCLKSIEKLYILSNIKIEIIIVDNFIKYNSFNLVKKIKKSFRYKIIQFHEKRRGIVYARNSCLSHAKKINPKFICFFDDDCVVDRYWIKNAFKVMKNTKAEVVTGPQLSLRKKYLKNYNLINYSQFFEKTYRDSIRRVYWASSNNVLLKYNTIKKYNLLFDKTLNKFGLGEDQLFFSKLNSYGSKIYWSKDIKVFENIHKHRLKLDWLIRRSFRLGVAGYYIDISVYGKTKGFIMNYLKCIYYFTKASLYILLFFKHKLRIQILNFFSRFYGRLIGPFMLKKIDFFKK